MEEFVRPGNEVLPVRRVGMTTVMLAPGQLAFEQSAVHRRQLLAAIVIGAAQITRTQQAEHRLRRDGGGPVTGPYNTP